MGYQGTLHEDSNEFYRENNAVNAIVSHYGVTARERGGELDIDIKVPCKLGVSDLGLSVIFGNCMENAMKACSRMETELQAISDLKRGWKVRHLQLSL